MTDVLLLPCENYRMWTQTLFKHWLFSIKQPLITISAFVIYFVLIPVIIFFYCYCRLIVSLHCSKLPVNQGRRKRKTRGCCGLDLESISLKAWYQSHNRNGIVVFVWTVTVRNLKIISAYLTENKARQLCQHSVSYTLCRHRVCFHHSSSTLITISVYHILVE